MIAALLLAALSSGAAGPPDLVVGSKNFPESRVLGEIVTQLLRERTGLEVEHRASLGGTLVCWNALVAGEIDVYPEYTGTAWSVVLKEPGRVADPLRAFLTVEAKCRARDDVEWLAPFGFENTYAMAMRPERAAELGVTRISDLARVGDQIRAGFSIESLNRDDGWPGLSAHYGLELADVDGIEHSLGYEAIARGDIDLIDAYSTDAKLLRYGLVVLEDDQGFYPPYDAAPVVNGATLREHPEVADALSELAFAIPADTMVRLNHAVEVEGREFADVAAEFLAELELVDGDARGGEHGGGGLLALALEHVLLTFVAVLLAAAIAIPVGIASTRNRALERVALGLASIAQTIPSLALLAFLIAVPGLGLSVRSAVVALTLYAVLPILRNTHTGIVTVEPDVVDAARGMGLTPRQVLTRIQLPLAMRTIVAGLRTATVISIGVATLAAFIGAGGLGERIVTGLYLNDVELILSGAVPAALLALLADRGIGALERRLTPRGLDASA